MFLGLLSHVLIVGSMHMIMIMLIMLIDILVMLTMMLGMLTMMLRCMLLRTMYLTIQCIKHPTH